MVVEVEMGGRRLAAAPVEGPTLFRCSQRQRIDVIGQCVASAGPQGRNKAQFVFFQSSG